MTSPTRTRYALDLSRLSQGPLHIKPHENLPDSNLIETQDRELVATLVCDDDAKAFCATKAALEEIFNTLFEILGKERSTFLVLDYEEEAKKVAFGYMEKWEVFMENIQKVIEPKLTILRSAGVLKEEVL